MAATSISELLGATQAPAAVPRGLARLGPGPGASGVAPATERARPGIAAPPAFADLLPPRVGAPVSGPAERAPAPAREASRDSGAALDTAEATLPGTTSPFIETNAEQLVTIKTSISFDYSSSAVARAAQHAPVADARSTPALDAFAEGSATATGEPLAGSAWPPGGKVPPAALPRGGRAMLAPTDVDTRTRTVSGLAEARTPAASLRGDRQSALAMSLTSALTLSAPRAGSLSSPALPTGFALPPETAESLLPAGVTEHAAAPRTAAEREHSPAAPERAQARAAASTLAQLVPLRADPSAVTRAHAPAIAAEANAMTDGARLAPLPVPSESGFPRADRTDGRAESRSIRVDHPGLTSAERPSPTDLASTLERVAAPSLPQMRTSATHETSSLLSPDTLNTPNPPNAGNAPSGPGGDLPRLAATAMSPSQPPLDAAQASDEFATMLGQRLIALAAHGEQRARIALHPAELGALDIRIHLREESVAVSITAQHGHARELIEAGLPRLRELFAEQGLDLANLDVSDQGGRPASRSHPEADAAEPVAPPAGVPVPRADPRMTPVRDAARLLDVLA